jgi:hypothetical protein
MSTTQPNPIAAAQQSAAPATPADPTAALQSKIGAAMQDALAKVTAQFAAEELADQQSVAAQNAAEDSAIAQRRNERARISAADRAARFELARQAAMRDAANRVFAEAAGMVSAPAAPGSLGDAGDRGHVGDLGTNAGK